MRSAIPLCALILAVPLSLLPQHSSGGSSSGSGSSGGSSSSGGGHSSGSSSTSSGSGGHANAGSSHGGTTSSSYHSGARSGDVSSSKTQPIQSVHQRADSTRAPEALKPPIPKPGEPGSSNQNPKREHRLFAFLAPHSVSKPPCRGKNCPAACPSGHERGSVRCD